MNNQLPYPHHEEVICFKDQACLGTWNVKCKIPKVLIILMRIKRMSFTWRICLVLFHVIFFLRLASKKTWFDARTNCFQYNLVLSSLERIHCILKVWLCLLNLINRCQCNYMYVIVCLKYVHQFNLIRNKSSPPTSFISPFEKQELSNPMSTVYPSYKV